MVDRYQLVLDATTRKPELLSSADYLEDTLKQVADLAAMRVLDIRTTEVSVDISRLGGVEFQDEGGTSVLALISTSHMAIHAWPLREFFMFDLVSCRPFDAREVTRYLLRRLAVGQVGYHMEVPGGVFGLLD